MFHTASWTKKLYIASSGILVNFFLAWIILFSIFAFYGIDQPTLEVATIGESISNPNDDAPSKKAGLMPGDIISTGTPPGVGLGMTPPVYLKAGDVVTLGIEGLGEHRQLVVAE